MKTFFNNRNKFLSITLPLVLVIITGILLLRYEKGNDVIILTYKEAGGNKLKLHIFLPEEERQGKKNAAFVFFHGGGWNTGKPEWGYEICRHFSSLGMAAVSVEYRLTGTQNNITPVECIEDAKSSIRWLRLHAREYNIDKNKIAAAGFSAGGHLAASTAVLKGFNDQGEDIKISSVPNLLIVWSGCVNSAADVWFTALINSSVPVETTSPYHNIRAGLPPSIIFHGTSDNIVPVNTVKEFHSRMIKYGNKSEINIYPGQVHMPWNKNEKDVYAKMESFLHRYGYIHTP